MDAQKIEQAYQTAFALHQQGRLAEAGDLYERLIKLLPGSPDLRHLLGVLRHQLGDHEAALTLIRDAIEVEPTRADFHCNLGMVLKATGEVDAAESAYRTAIELDPNHVDALANLGGLLQQLDKLDEARAVLERAISIHAGHPIAWTNLGNVLSMLGDLTTAEQAQRQAVALAPLDPTTQINLATTLMDQQRTAEAEPVFRVAGLLNPDVPEVWNNLAFVHMNRHEFAAAERFFRRAIAVQPRYGAPHAGLADIHYLLGEPEAALVHSERAVELMPANPQIRFRRSLQLLGSGRIGEGWDLRDARLDKPDAIRRDGAPPRWNGEPLTGRRVLIGAEEGVGDEILFAQCFNEAIAEAEQCFIECDPRILPVFRRSFPDAMVAAYVRGGTRTRPAHSYEWLPSSGGPEVLINAGSLQRIYRRDLGAYENRPPYLLPDLEKASQWRDIIAGWGDRPKIGVCWRSRALSSFRNVHYTDLTQWGDLLTLPDVEFVSLQYGEGWEEEIEDANRRFGSNLRVLDGVDTTNDFDTIFAVVAGLDLVVCPSSTVSWIAGSMGVPTWCLITRTNFMQLGTDHFPGFPSMRSYDRVSTEPWEPVLARLRDDLVTWLGESDS